jgi:hypothetical protein
MSQDSVLREKIAESIYTQEMDSNLHNFISWEQAKTEPTLSYVISDFNKRADAILAIVLAGLPEKKDPTQEWKNMMSIAEEKANEIMIFAQGYNTAIDEIKGRMGVRK